MTTSDRPILGLEIEFQIETAQNQTHINFWPQLQHLQEPTPQTDQANRKLWPIVQLQPPAPQRPYALRRVLSNYAALLFLDESEFYPNNPQLPHWLNQLAERIASSVLGIVTKIEEMGAVRGVTLKHHGLTPSDMRQAIATGIEQQTKLRLANAIKAQVKADIANASRAGSAASAAGSSVREMKPKRLSATIHCPKAARKMEDYIAKNGLDQTKFAIKAGTTDRTLRNFRKTGKIRRDIFEDIAKAMGTTKEALIKA